MGGAAAVTNVFVVVSVKNKGALSASWFYFGQLHFSFATITDFITFVCSCFCRVRAGKMKRISELFTSFLIFDLVSGDDEF